MKLISEMVQGLIPECPADKMIYAVQNKRLDSPMIASEIRCPTCGGSSGYYIPCDRMWMCKKLCYSDMRSFYGLFHEVKKQKSKQLDPLRHVNQSDPVMKWAREWLKNPTGYVLISGKNGSGKTFFAKSLLEGFSSEQWEKKFYVLSELNMEWKDSQSQWKSDTQLCKNLSDYKILILDDLGSIRVPTDPFLDFLYTLIDSRYRHKKVTIITTNLNYPDLREKFGDAIASRVTSGKCMRFDGADRRRTPF